MNILEAVAILKELLADKYQVGLDGDEIEAIELAIEVMLEEP